MDAQASTPSTSLGQSAENASSVTLSPLEQEILDEYARLVGNLNNLSASLATMSVQPTGEILDNLRGLERRTSLVFTLLKASVYSIVLQQQIEGEEDQGGQGLGGVYSSRQALPSNDNVMFFDPNASMFQPCDVTSADNADLDNLLTKSLSGNFGMS
ncbi:MAG: hypothetical protein M1820_008167 [Bogoriella megaspora]|nr:MAG: hypothetical protein M1820_008167 [Bogoriella megaspora]